MADSVNFYYIYYIIDLYPVILQMVMLSFTKYKKTVKSRWMSTYSYNIYNKLYKIQENDYVDTKIVMYCFMVWVIWPRLVQELTIN